MFRIGLVVVYFSFFSTPFAQIPTTIDLLVLYSGNAKFAAGGETTIRALIAEAVGFANIAFSNSLAYQRVRLVRMEETPLEYTDPGIMCISRDRLQNPSDNYLDFVHGLRNQVGADIVVIVTNDGVPEFGAGCAYICGYDGPCSANFSGKGFAAVKWDYLNRDVLTHELGHVMGLMHERSAVGCPGSCKQGAAPDGYGYSDQSGSLCWATVMYSRTVYSACSERGDGFSGIRYFSNPDILHPTRGVPLGIDHSINPNNSANNARVLREVTRNVVARWRDNSLSGLIFTHSGSHTAGAKFSIDSEDGDVHLKGTSKVGYGPTLNSLQFYYRGTTHFSIQSNGDIWTGGVAENHSQFPIEALRITKDNQIMLVSDLNRHLLLKSIVDINSIP